MYTQTLEVTTSSDRDVVIRRRFDAPAPMVFEALTTPELLRRWCCPDGWQMETCEVDLRVGGKWRFVMVQPEGRRIGQFGEYQEVLPSSRLVQTEQWEDWDAGQTLVTTTLTENDGGTEFTSTIRFPSKEVRDIVLANGFSESAPAMYEKLANLLQEKPA